MSRPVLMLISAILLAKLAIFILGKIDNDSNYNYFF
jgi:hypothetical protein